MVTVLAMAMDVASDLFLASGDWTIVRMIDGINSQAKAGK